MKKMTTIEKVQLAAIDPDKLVHVDDYNQMFACALEGLKFPWTVFFIGWTAGLMTCLLIWIAIHGNKWQ